MPQLDKIYFLSNFFISLVGYYFFLIYVFVFIFIDYYCVLRIRQFYLDELQDVYNTLPKTDSYYKKVLLNFLK